MANRTDTQADTIHGGNPQYLVDRIVRVKIYNDWYWKESCFGLTSETLIDKAAEIDYVAGTYGGRRRPAKFLCLFLKLLQIQPDEDVIMEYIKQSELKYLRALGAAYYRLAGRPKKVHEVLEPLYADYRKLRYRDMSGKLSIIHMDEWIDWLLREDNVVDVTLPQMPKREIMEMTVDLAPRESVLDDDLDDLEDLEAAVAAAAQPEGASGSAGGSGGAAGAEEAAAAPEEAAPADSPPASPRRSRSARRRSRERGRSAEPRRRREGKRSRSRSASRASKSRSSSAPARPAPKEERWKKDKKAAKEKKEKKAKKDKGSNKEERKGGKKEKDGELSVEGWNDVRASLGLKPLKT